MLSMLEGEKGLFVDTENCRKFLQRQQFNESLAYKSFKNQYVMLLACLLLYCYQGVNR